jgi:antibiotic biosynthesis monooxygenase (ABM) superfamily enzyme
MARTIPVAAGSGDRPTVTSGLMVAAMTWVVVPVMTWLFRGWLARSPSAPTTRGWASCEEQARRVCSDMPARSRAAWSSA